MGKIERRIEVDADLLKRAEDQGLSLNEVVDAALRSAVREEFDLVATAKRQKADPEGAKERARKWREDSAETIADINRFVDEHGEFLKEFRAW